MIHVIAIITAKAGQRSAVLKEFQANVPNVLAEQGCIEYSATCDTAPSLSFQTPFGDDTFVVIEKWDSVEALEAHSTAPHMVRYGAAVREMTASRVIHVLSASE